MAPLSPGGAWPGLPCSWHSVAAGGRLVPHAPPVATGWVLVEHPGPWGTDPESRLVPEAVRIRVRERGLRLHLIRRHHRREQPARSQPARSQPAPSQPARSHRPAQSPPPITCLLAAGTGPRPFVHTGHLGDPAELLDLDLDAVAAGQPPAWGTPVVGPVYLVCTHGRVDACCARYGRPVARQLAAVAGDRVWETTHVGGCRFASNVVCLPHGIYYGRVAPAETAELVAAVGQDMIAERWHRGRAGLPRAAQAAESYLRRAVAARRVEEVGFVCQQRLDEDTDEVTLTAAGVPHRLVVRREVLPPLVLTCRDTRPRHPVGYRVIEVTRAGATGGWT